VPCGLPQQGGSGVPIRNSTTGSTLPPSVFVIPERSLAQHQCTPYNQARSHRLRSVSVDRYLSVRPVTYILAGTLTGASLHV